MSMFDVKEVYRADERRYDGMEYRRCGRSGVLLSAVALGLWHNFGGYDVYDNARDIVRRAFDLGVTYLDLANNYGPPFGSAEETFGRILRQDFLPYRDELFIATKQSGCKPQADGARLCGSVLSPLHGSGHPA